MSVLSLGKRPARSPCPSEPRSESFFWCLFFPQGCACPWSQSCDLSLADLAPSRRHWPPILSPSQAGLGVRPLDTNGVCSPGSIQISRACLLRPCLQTPGLLPARLSDGVGAPAATGLLVGLGDGGQCKTQEASRLSRAVTAVACGRPSAQASLPGIATY